MIPSAAAGGFLYIDVEETITHRHAELVSASDELVQEIPKPAFAQLRQGRQVRDDEIVMMDHHSIECGRKGQRFEISPPGERFTREQVAEQLREAFLRNVVERPSLNDEADELSACAPSELLLATTTDGRQTLLSLAPSIQTLGVRSALVAASRVNLPIDPALLAHPVIRVLADSRLNSGQDEAKSWFSQLLSEGQAFAETSDGITFWQRNPDEPAVVVAYELPMVVTPSGSVPPESSLPTEQIEKPSDSSESADDSPPDSPAVSDIAPSVQSVTEESADLERITPAETTTTQEYVLQLRRLQNGELDLLLGDQPFHFAGGAKEKAEVIAALLGRGQHVAEVDESDRPYRKTELTRLGPVDALDRPGSTVDIKLVATMGLTKEERVEALMQGNSGNDSDSSGEEQSDDTIGFQGNSPEAQSQPERTEGRLYPLSLVKQGDGYDLMTPSGVPFRWDGDWQREATIQALLGSGTSTDTVQRPVKSPRRWTFTRLGNLEDLVHTGAIAVLLTVERPQQELLQPEGPETSTKSTNNEPIGSDSDDSEQDWSEASSESVDQESQELSSSSDDDPVAAQRVSPVLLSDGEIISPHQPNELPVISTSIGHEIPSARTFGIASSEVELLKHGHVRSVHVSRKQLAVGDQQATPPQRRIVAQGEPSTNMAVNETSSALVAQSIELVGSGQESNSALLRVKTTVSIQGTLFEADGLEPAVLPQKQPGQPPAPNKYLPTKTTPSVTESATHKATAESVPTWAEATTLAHQALGVTRELSQTDVSNVHLHQEQFAQSQAKATGGATGAIRSVQRSSQVTKTERQSTLERTERQTKDAVWTTVTAATSSGQVRQQAERTQTAKSQRNLWTAAQTQQSEATATQAAPQISAAAQRKTRETARGSAKSQVARAGINETKQVTKVAQEQRQAAGKAAEQRSRQEVAAEAVVKRPSERVARALAEASRSDATAARSRSLPDEVQRRRRLQTQQARSLEAALPFGARDTARDVIESAVKRKGERSSITGAEVLLQRQYPSVGRISPQKIRSLEKVVEELAFQPVTATVHDDRVVFALNSGDLEAARQFSELAERFHTRATERQFTLSLAA